MTHFRKSLPNPITPPDVSSKANRDHARTTEEAEAMIRELTEDLIDRDRTIVELHKEISALNQSGGEPDLSVAKLESAPVAPEMAPVEHREKSNVQSAPITTPQGATRVDFGNRPEKLIASVRRAGSALKRKMNRLRGRVLTSGTPAGGNSVPELSESERLSISARAHRLINAEQAPINEQALRQIYTRTGVDAWDGYVHRALDGVDAEQLDVKAIAFYIPEFYSVRGEHESTVSSVTPWTSISEALPRYLGHYQPHRPGELGFYDLRLPDVLRQQVGLAKQYGIYGFCFHHYWSEGRQSLGQPLSKFLSDPSLNIMFCVCWMNEERPKSKENTGLVNQDSSADETALIESLEAVFSDPRYIRIDGRPLLIVYRPAILTDALAIGRRWRDRAKRMGYPDLYLVASQADDAADPRPIEFDAAVEYPPHDTPVTEITSECSLIDPDFSGHVYTYREVFEANSARREQPYINFKAVMTDWDDESKRPGIGTSFAGSTPALYARWLDRCCRITMARRPEERMVFINGWNNWSNGAHLEPDRKFGYAYLQAGANILRQYRNVVPAMELIESINSTFVPSSQTAIIFHCHYEDLIAPILDRYLADRTGADVFVTVHPDISSEAIEQFRRKISNVYFFCLENRGRDIRTFMLALQHIRSLGYVTACKLHTKKTPQAVNGFGESWRQRLIGSLLGSTTSVASALERFSSEPALGILAPERSLMDLSLPENHIPNAFWLDRLLQRMNRSDLIGNYSFRFPAGSMFWFRVEALAGFDELILAGDAFEPELGQRDGTLSHAAERLVTLYAQERGFYTKEISDDSPT